MIKIFSMATPPFRKNASPPNQFQTGRSARNQLGGEYCFYRTPISLRA